MKTISLKIQGNLLKEIDSKMKNYRYGTRTEFIRDAIREKLSILQKEEILKELAKLQRLTKHKTADEQLHKAGEKAFKKLEKKFGLS